MKLMKKIIWKINQKGILERGVTEIRRKRGRNIRIHVNCASLQDTAVPNKLSIFLTNVYAT